ncbi:PPR1B phosphatase, partial [Crypturellus soui]|nr:PPR1B phosphatase [Crypturellus soui]
MDPKDRKKIQFSVPAPPSQLDPRAVEMIRRRRPTPAMLFQLSEHSSPGRWRCHPDAVPRSQRGSGEGCLLKPKRTNPCAYTPPSLKGSGTAGTAGTARWQRGGPRALRPPRVAAVQRIVQSHLESGLGGGDSSDGEADDGEHEAARAGEEPEVPAAPGGTGGGLPAVPVPTGVSAPSGGQKVSFAGGFDEREEEPRALAVTEIPEDPEGGGSDDGDGDEREAEEPS